MVILQHVFTQLIFLSSNIVQQVFTDFILGKLSPRALPNFKSLVDKLIQAEVLLIYPSCKSIIHPHPAAATINDDCSQLSHSP